MKKTFKLFFLLFLCLLLSGCWDKVEMEDRSYVITLGIDKYKGEQIGKIDNAKKNKFSLSLGIAELSEMSEQKKGKENDEKKAIEIAGQTIASAIKGADMYSSRQIYLGQLKTVVFGEEILKNKKAFQEALEALERNQEVSTKTIILATEGKAVDCVNAILAENASSGLFIWDFYKNTAENVATTGRLDLENILIDLRNTGNTVIPKIKVENKKLKLGGGVLVSDYTVKGYLKDLEERGYLWLRGRAEGAVVEGKFHDNAVAMWALNNRSDFGFTEENGTITCRMTVEVDGGIEGGTTGRESLLNEHNIEQLEQQYEQIIKEEVQNIIWLTQSRYHTDSLQLVRQLQKKEPDLYEKQNKTDQQIFEEMNLKPDVSVRIRSVGVIE